MVACAGAMTAAADIGSNQQAEARDREGMVEVGSGQEDCSIVIVMIIICNDIEAMQR